MLGVLFLCLATLLSGLPASLVSAQPAPFARGSRVKLTAASPVLAYYGLAYLPYGFGTQPSGVLGSVLGGPRTADGVAWVNVDFDTQVDGRTVDGWVQASVLTAQTPDTQAPGVPAGLKAVPVAYNQVNLTWTRAVDNVKAGIVLHRVLRDGVLIATTASTNYQDVERLPQTASTYTLQAVDLAGNVSGLSPPVSVTTPATPATHPTSAMSPGTWSRVPNSTFRTTQYVWDPAIFAGSQMDDVFTEGGCAYDEQRSRFLCWGGGHASYGGNELYQFSVETLQWARLSEPSLLIDNAGVGLNDQVYFDGNGDPDYGQPRPPHVHTSVFYDPKGDQFCMTAGQGGFPDNTYYAGTPQRPGAARERRGFCYDFATKVWKRLNPTGSGQNPYGAYDPTTGLWWQRGNIQLPWSTFASWDMRTDTWAIRNPSVPAVYDYEKTAAIDTKRGLFVAAGFGGIAPVITYDLRATGPLAEREQLTSGHTDLLQWGRFGFEYLPHLDRFIAWTGRDGAEAGVVYALDPATWTWTKVAPDAANTVVPPAYPGVALSWRQGPETRWRYDPRYEVFTALVSIYDDVYLYKLPATLPAPPPPVPTPLKVTNLAAPAITTTAVTLTWASPAQPAGTVYVVLRDGVEVGRTIDATTLSYTDSTVLPALPYRYSVKAVLGTLETAPTPTLFVTTKTAPGGPPVVPAYTPGSQVRHMVPGNNFAETTRSLKPGDTLIVHAGTYYDTTRPSITVRGTASQPVLIMGAPGEAKPVITRPAAADLQNTVNLEGAAYVSLRGLEIVGNGGDGVRLASVGANVVSNIVLEDNDIHHVAVGVNYRTSMDTITVRHNHIHHLGILQSTGEGMYVGCNAAPAPCAVTNSIFDNNWIHTSLPGTTQGDGIEIKIGSCNNKITNNVIHDVFYPGIFVYGGCPVGQENLVEGNVVWGTPEGIYAVSDAVVRNNILFGNGNGLSLYGHAQVPSIQRLTITHNTLYGNDEGLYINWPGLPPTIILANNAIYGAGKHSAVWAVKPLPTSVVASRNIVEGPLLGGPALDGVRWLSGGPATQAFIDPPTRQFWLAPTSPLRGTADPAYTSALDFNATARTLPYDVGAYEVEAFTSNPGWAIVPGFKDAAVLPPPPPPFDFALTVTPAALTLGPTQAAVVTIQAQTVAGIAQTVSFSVPGSGAQNIVPPMCLPTPACQATVTFPPNAAVADGVYTVPITGTAGSVSHQGLLTMTVQRPVVPDSVRVTIGGKVYTGPLTPQP